MPELRITHEGARRIVLLSQKSVEHEDPELARISRLTQELLSLSPLTRLTFKLRLDGDFDFIVKFLDGRSANSVVKIGPPVKSNISAADFWTVPELEKSVQLSASLVSFHNSVGISSLDYRW